MLSILRWRSGLGTETGLKYYNTGSYNTEMHTRNMSPCKKICKGILNNHLINSNGSYYYWTVLHFHHAIFFPNRIKEAIARIFHIMLATEYGIFFFKNFIFFSIAALKSHLQSSLACVWYVKEIPMKESLGSITWVMEFIASWACVIITPGHPHSESWLGMEIIF